MFEIFKTVLILSLFGFMITIILLCLKPITTKKFPAIWQYYMWIVVMLSMILPVYKLIPQSKTQKIPILPQTEIVQQEENETVEEVSETVIIEETPMEYREVNITPDYRIRIFDLIAYIWVFGVIIFLAVVISSYFVYVTRKRKKSVLITEYALMDSVKSELSVNRKIKIRMTDDLGSPMLVGLLFPTIYIPYREISDDCMRMVLLHELTHYKRKDLAVKWFSILVNAVHWFNPIAYILCANVSESCEVSCDMKVTKNMSDEEQKLYMKTILDLA